MGKECTPFLGSALYLSLTKLFLYYGKEQTRVEKNYHPPLFSRYRSKDGRFLAVLMCFIILGKNAERRMSSTCLPWV